MSSNQSIELYKSLKRLKKAQLNEVCFYLKNEYDYDLGFVDLDKAPNESANGLIEFIEQYSQGLSHLSKVINEVTKTPNLPNNPRDIGAYLINRQDEYKLLGDAISKHDKQYPFLCLIHGDKYQHHHRYFQRLVLYDLPKYNRYKAFGNETPKFLSGIFRKNTNVCEAILVGISSLFNFYSKKIDEIIKAIETENAPILFYAILCTEDLQLGEMELIHQFLKFWANESFKFKSKHLIMICLYVNYTEKRTKFFNRWRKKTSINNEIEQKIEQLKLDELGVKGIVLPKLKNISKRDVEDWAAEHLRDYLDILTPEIDKLFQSETEEKTMEYLVKQLESILNERCKKSQRSF